MAEMREGGCGCGDIRYQFTCEPLSCYACHCTDCQTRSGAAFTLSAIIPLAEVSVTRGDPGVWQLEIADFRYCMRCGVKLWGVAKIVPDFALIQVGTLDDTSWVRPVAHIWTGSAQSWIGLILLAAILVDGLHDQSRRPAALLLLLSGLSITFNGGDWMVLSRFWVTGLPLVYLLFVAFLRGHLANRPRETVALIAVTALLCVDLLLWGARERMLSYGQAHPFRPSAASCHRVTRLLLDRARPGDSVALMDIGQVGYETKLPIIDISGLTDRRIAKSPGGFLDKRYPVSYLLAREPRFFVLRPSYSIDARIFSDQEFQKRYRPLTSIALFMARPLIVFEREVNDTRLSE